MTTEDRVKLIMGHKDLIIAQLETTVEQLQKENADLKAKQEQKPESAQS